MFRFETAVQVLVLSVTAVFTQISLAETVTLGGNSGDAYLKCLDGISAGKYTKEQCEDLKPAGRRGNNCPDAMDEYEKKRAEFSAKCDGIPDGKGAGKSSGDVACEWTFTRCMHCNGGKKASSKYQCESGGGGGGLQKILTAAQSIMGGGMGGGVDVGAKETQYFNCPYMAGTDLDKLKSDLDKQRDKIKEAEDKIPDLEEKLGKAERENKKELRDLRDKMAKDQADHSKELRDSAKNKDSALRALQDRVFAANAEIAKMKSAITGEDIALADELVKKEQAIIQADLQCQGRATEQVMKEQNDILAGTGGSLSTRWIRGGMRSIMKLAGRTTEKFWEQRASYFKEKCRRSDFTKEAKNASEKVYETKKNRANKAKVDLQEQIQAKLMEIESLQNKYCGPLANGEVSESCKVIQHAQEDATAQIQAFDTKRNASMQNYQELQMQGYQDQQRTQQAITKKQYDNMRENFRLMNNEQLYNVKNDLSGGTNITQKEIGEARSAMGALASAAAALVNKCNEDDKGAAEACRFLKRINDGYKCKWEKSLQASEPPTTTPPSAPAPVQRTVASPPTSTPDPAAVRDGSRPANGGDQKHNP